MLAKILIEDCTELNLYVGKPLTALTRIRDSPLIWGIRQNLVRQLRRQSKKWENELRLRTIRAGYYL